MKKALISFLIFIAPSSFAASAQIEAVGRDCDGPFRSQGDMALLRGALENARKRLQDKCDQLGQGSGQLYRLDRISEIEIGTSAVACAEIKVSTSCTFAQPPPRP